MTLILLNCILLALSDSSTETADSMHQRNLDNVRRSAFPPAALAEAPPPPLPRLREVPLRRPAVAVSPEARRRRRRRATYASRHRRLGLA
jgi:hypothetical protein